MKLEVEDCEGYCLVRCSGVLASGIREYAGDTLHPLIEDPNARLLIDLSAVDRITSEGISALVTLVARANTKGARVVFVCPSPFVQAVFETTKIDRFLETYSTIDEGRKQLLVNR